MTPLTPRDSPSDSRIVIDCPECHRTIWAGTRCHHGAVVLGPVVPKDDQVLVEAPAAGRRKLKGGTG